MIPLSHLAPSNIFRICPTDAVRAMRIRRADWLLRPAGIHGSKRVLILGPGHQGGRSSQRETKGKIGF